MNDHKLTILDASVAIKWFFLEEGSDRAQRILKDLLTSPKSFAVPELFFFETSNTLNRLIADDQDQRFELFEILLTVGMLRFPFTEEIFRGARKFQHLGLSGYDSAYLVLAEQSNGTWITADKKAHAAANHLGLSSLL